MCSVVKKNLNAFFLICKVENFIEKVVKLREKLKSDPVRSIPVIDLDEFFSSGVSYAESVRKLKELRITHTVLHCFLLQLMRV